MDYILYVFPFFFLLYAVVYLFIAFKALIKNKPSIISSEWLYALIFFSVMPLTIYNIVDLFRFGFGGSFGLVSLMVPMFDIVFLIFFYFVMKGYCVYCVSDADFRNALIFSLNNVSIKFEETMSKIELTELNNELNISFTAWIGAGALKLKNRKDKIIFKKIIGGIGQYFKENNIKPKKMVAIFYLIFGILFIIFGAGFVKFLIR